MASARGGEPESTATSSPVTTIISTTSTSTSAALRRRRPDVRQRASTPTPGNDGDESISSVDEDTVREVVKVKDSPEGILRKKIDEEKKIVSESPKKERPKDLDIKSRIAPLAKEEASSFLWPEPSEKIINHEKEVIKKQIKSTGERRTRTSTAEKEEVKKRSASAHGEKVENSERRSRTSTAEKEEIKKRSSSAHNEKPRSAEAPIVQAPERRSRTSTAEKEEIKRRSASAHEEKPQARTMTSTVEKEELKKRSSSMPRSPEANKTTNNGQEGKLKNGESKTKIEDKPVTAIPPERKNRLSSEEIKRRSALLSTSTETKQEEPQSTEPEVPKRTSRKSSIKVSEADSVYDESSEEIKEKEVKDSLKVPELKITPVPTPQKEEKRIPWRVIIRETRNQWRLFVKIHPVEVGRIKAQRNRCISDLILMLILCGLGALMFRFAEGAFESLYKCGVKRVKRDFVDVLWLKSHSLHEEDWKSMARRRLMEFEEQLHTAHEAGVRTYSGQKSWSFLNGVIYCLTVITTIGYGHISPSTTAGRALTIIYAIFGIPLFLILLADFGKLFTRGIKFLWAFVRRLYYTGSCRKVRRTVPVQEVMKGVQLVYDFATFRRPSQQYVPGIPVPPVQTASAPVTAAATPHIPVDGNVGPSTPSPSAFEVDDEFNLPISVAIVILVIYVVIGATMFWFWEEWTFFESFYFVFISMSTIGFGDFVPNNPMYMMASIIYLVFGLALTSMCINVVQEKLSDSFRQASAKLGATIGLRMAEEGGMIPPQVPPNEAAPEESVQHPPSIPKSATN